MIKGLQVENSIYNRESTKGENSSSTGRSTCSDKSQSPSNISSKNQVEILDQMDYYRSAMTRSEAEKVCLVCGKYIFENFWNYILIMNFKF